MIDLAGGFNNPIWARTIRFKDQIGGAVKAANREVLVDPWNPVAGTNWVYDTVILICVNDEDTIYNPYTGLPVPNRFEEVTVEVEDGMQIIATSPWLNLTFVDYVEVPPDAWFGWNTTTKSIITAPSGTYAKAKVTVNYGDVIGNVKYHDGSVMSLADWFALWPLTFERADPTSPLYDSSAVPGFNAFRKNFRGLRIVSESPLVVEYYINYTNLEAEFMAAWAAEWPNMPWHAVAPGIYAEEQGELAFSASKAEEKGVEWMNYIGGPSLDILASDLDEMIATEYIPFVEHACGYITAEEAVARYRSLRNWYNTHGHFWVASGPFYLDTVSFMGHSAMIKAFRNYTYRADRWAWLMEYAEFPPEFPPKMLEIYPSSPVYTWGEIVNLTAVYRTSYGVPIENGTVLFQVNYPNNTLYFAKAKNTNSEGIANILFLIDVGEASGNYTVYATAFKPGFDNASATTRFAVVYLIPMLEVWFVGPNITLVDQEAELRLHVKNVGNGTAYGVNVTLHIPEGFTTMYSNTSYIGDIETDGEVLLVAGGFSEKPYRFVFTANATYMSAWGESMPLISAEKTLIYTYHTDYLVDLINMAMTVISGKIIVNLTVTNYGDHEVNVTLIASAQHRETELMIKSPYQAILIQGGETKTISLAINVSPIAPLGEYVVQGILTTGLPVYEGFALTYREEEITI